MLWMKDEIERMTNSRSYGISEITLERNEEGMMILYVALDEDMNTPSYTYTTRLKEQRKQLKKWTKETKDSTGFSFLKRHSLV